MAKKNKIIIKDEELTPTIIGEVDKKQIGLIYLIFVFIILVTFVFYLPEISVFVEDYLNSSTVAPNTVVEEDLTYVSGMNISGDYVNLSNIVISNYMLTFDMENISEKAVALEDEEIYLEIYDAEDNLIKRIDFSGITLASGEIYSYETELSYDDVDYFVYEKISVENYPAVELNLDEDEVENLVCSKDNVILTYKFSSGLLYSITNKTNIEDEEFDEYNSLAYTYNNVDGIESSVEGEVDMYFTYFIDLSVYAEDINEYDMLYEYKTSAKVINFEMVTEGFDCY